MGVGCVVIRSCIGLTMRCTRRQWPPHPSVIAGQHRPLPQVSYGVRPQENTFALAKANKMKKPLLSFRIITVVLIAAVLFIVKWQHRLLTPTTEQLQNAFPGETRQVLEQSDHFTLLSLEPTKAAITKEQEVTSFHGYRVIGRMEVNNSSEKQKLLRAVDDGIARSSPSLPACFSPRHGIHAVAGSQSVDLVICFHCEQFEIYWGKSNKLSGISNAPQGTFDHILSSGGITPVQQ